MSNKFRTETRDIQKKRKCTDSSVEKRKETQISENLLRARQFFHVKMRNASKSLSNNGSKCLDDANLVGDVEGVVGRGQTDVRLLEAVGANQRVHLRRLDLIQLADGLLDLGLVGARVDDEREGVVLLNLLHGHVGVQRVLDDTERVPLVLDRLGVVARLDRGGLAECVWATELRAGVRLAGRHAHDLGRLCRSSLHDGLLHGLGGGLLGGLGSLDLLLALVLLGSHFDEA